MKFDIIYSSKVGNCSLGFYVVNMSHIVIIKILEIIEVWKPSNKKLFFSVFFINRDKLKLKTRRQKKHLTQPNLT